MNLETLVLELVADDSKLSRDIDSAVKKATKKLAAIEKVGTISPSVDLDSLHELNKVLDSKQRHIKETAKIFNSTPIVVKVNTSSVSRAKSEVAALRGELAGMSTTVKAEITHKFEGQKQQSNAVVAEVKQLGVTLKQINSKTKKNGLLGEIRTGLFAGIGQNLSEDFSKSFLKSFQSRSGVDLGFTGKLIGDALGRLENLIEDGIRNSGKRIVKSSGIDKAVIDLGDVLANSLVDALESSVTPSELAVNFAERLSINLEKFGESIKDAGKALIDINTYMDAIGVNYDKNKQSVLQTPLVQAVGKAVAPVVGSVVSQRRKGKQSETLPLVAKRASQILEESQGMTVVSPADAQKMVNKGQSDRLKVRLGDRTTSAPNVIDDGTNELFITIGGYAGHKTKASGYRIAGDIVEQAYNQGRTDVAAIGIRNPDTDINPEAMKYGTTKMMGLLGSLAKPNLRGYSKDAVEIAAQAIAAITKNPNIQVKIVGESGGGFAAEEAVSILQKMGYSNNVSGIALGTPNFIGGLNPDNFTKLLGKNQAETLGYETHQVYAPMGFADVSDPNQNLVGLEGHPYEHYLKTKQYQSFIGNDVTEQPQQQLEVGQDDIDQVRVAINDLVADSESTIDDLKNKLKFIQRQLENAFSGDDAVNSQIQSLVNEIKSLSSDDELLGELRKYYSVIESAQVAINQAMMSGDGDQIKTISKELGQLQIELQQKIINSTGDVKERLEFLMGQFKQQSTMIGNPNKDPKAFRYQFIAQNAQGQVKGRNVDDLKLMNQEVTALIKEITDDKKFNVKPEAQRVKDALIQVKRSIIDELKSASDGIKSTDIWDDNYSYDQDMQGRQTSPVVKKVKVEAPKTYHPVDPFTAIAESKQVTEDGLLPVTNNIHKEIVAIHNLLKTQYKQGDKKADKLARRSEDVIQGELVDLTETNKLQKLLVGGGHGVGQAVQQAYGVLSGAEQFTFDLVKGLSGGLVDLGAAKRVTQMVAPGVMLGMASSNPLIGGAMSMASDAVVTPLLSSGLGAAAHGVAGLLPSGLTGGAATMAGWLGHIPGAGALGAGISELGAGALGAAGTGLTYLLGGRAAAMGTQFALNQAVKPLGLLPGTGQGTQNATYNALTGTANVIGGVVNNVNQLRGTAPEVKMPLLPPRQVEYVQVEVLPSEPRQIAGRNSRALPPSRNYGNADDVGQELKNITGLVEDAIQDDNKELIESAYNRAQEILSNLKGSSKKVEDVIKTGNLEFAKVYAENVKAVSELAANELQRITEILKSAGLNTNIGASGMLGSFNALKSNVSGYAGKMSKDKLPKIERLQKNALYVDHDNIQQVLGQKATELGGGDEVINKANQIVSALSKLEGIDLKQFFTINGRLNKVGKEVMAGLQKGLLDGEGNIDSTIKDLAESLPEQVKKILGIASPSKVFIQIGKDLVRGFVIGVNGEIQSIEDLTLPIPELEKQGWTDLEKYRDVMNSIKLSKEALQDKANSDYADKDNFDYLTRYAQFQDVGDDITYDDEVKWKRIQKEYKKQQKQNPVKTDNVVGDAPKVPEQSTESVNKFDKALDMLSDQVPIIGQLRQQFNGLLDTVKKFGLLAVSGLGLALLAKGLFDVGKGALEAYQNIEGVFIASKLLKGSEQFISDLRQQSLQLGSDLQSTLEQGIRFSSALVGTPLEDMSQQMFKDAQTALTYMGLQQQQYDSALLALTQVASKGRVSLEEITGQLGEAVPGIMPIVANALGTNVQGAIQQIESGNVLAEDLMPKLIAEMKNRTAGLAPIYERSLTASTGRVGTALQGINIGIGEQLAPAVIPAINKVAEALISVSENIDKVMQGVKYLAIGLTANLGVALAGVAAKALTMGGALTVVNGIFKGLTLAVHGLGLALKPLLIALGAIAAFEGLNFAFNFKGDQAILDAIKSVDTLIGKIKELRLEEEKRRNAQNQKTPFGFDSTKQTQTGLFSDNPFLSAMDFINPTRFFGGTTYGDVAFDRNIEKQEELSTKVNEAFSVGGVSNIFNTKSLDDYLSKIIAIDEQISILQGRSTALRLVDAQANADEIDAISQQITQLNNQRSKLGQNFLPIGIDGINQAIDVLKAQIEFYSGLKAEAELAGDEVRYNNATQSIKELTNQLGLAERAASTYDDRMKELGNTLNAQRLAFIDLSAAVLQANVSINDTLNAERTALTNSQIENGLQSQINQFQDLSFAVYDAQKRLENLQDIMALQKQYIGSNKIDTQIKQTIEDAAGKSINDLNAGDVERLKLLAENDTQGRLKAAFNDQVVGVLEQIGQTNSQAIEAGKSLADARKALAEFNITKEDYFINLARQIEDLNFQIESQQIQDQRSLQDLSFQVQDASVSLQRSNRALGEAYQDMAFDFNVQVATVGKAINDAQDQLELTQLRINNLSITPGNSGSIARQIDDILLRYSESVFGTQSNERQIKIDILNLEKERIQRLRQIRDFEERQMDATRDFSRQIITLQRAFFDLERNMKQAAVGFVRQIFDMTRAMKLADNSSPRAIQLRGQLQAVPQYNPRMVLPAPTGQIYHPIDLITNERNRVQTQVNQSRPVTNYAPGDTNILKDAMEQYNGFPANQSKVLINSLQSSLNFPINSGQIELAQTAQLGGWIENQINRFGNWVEETQNKEPKTLLQLARFYTRQNQQFLDGLDPVLVSRKLAIGTFENKSMQSAFNNLARSKGFPQPSVPPLPPAQRVMQSPEYQRRRENPPQTIVANNPANVAVPMAQRMNLAKHYSRFYNQAHNLNLNPKQLESIAKALAEYRSSDKKLQQQFERYVNLSDAERRAVVVEMQKIEQQNKVAQAKVKQNDQTRALGSQSILNGKPVYWAGEDWKWQSEASYRKLLQNNFQRSTPPTIKAQATITQASQPQVVYYPQSQQDVPFIYQESAPLPQDYNPYGFYESVQDTSIGGYNFQAPQVQPIQPLLSQAATLENMNNTLIELRKNGVKAEALLNFVQMNDSLNQLINGLDDAKESSIRNVEDTTLSVNQLVESSKGWLTITQKVNRAGDETFTQYENQIRTLSDTIRDKERLLQNSGSSLIKLEAEIEKAVAMGFDSSNLEAQKQKLANLIEAERVNKNSLQTLLNQVTATQDIAVANAKNNAYLQEQLNYLDKMAGLAASISSARYDLGGSLINEAPILQARVAMATAEQRAILQGRNDGLDGQALAEYVDMSKELASINYQKSFSDAIPFVKELGANLKEAVFETGNFTEAFSKLLRVMASDIFDRLVLMPLTNKASQWLGETFNLGSQSIPTLTGSLSVGNEVVNNPTVSDEGQVKFEPFNQAIESVAQTSQSYGSELANLTALTTTQVVTEQAALNQFVMALQMATQALYQFAVTASSGGVSSGFGSVFGTIGKSVGGLFSGDVSSLAGDFTPGNVIGVDSSISIPTFANGLTEQRMTGRKPMLAIVNEGEAILSTLNGDAQKFQALKRSGTWDDIPNFANGVDRFYNDSRNYRGDWSMESMLPSAQTRQTINNQRNQVVNQFSQNYTIVTPNADSFRKSQSQIQDEGARTYRRKMR